MKKLFIGVALLLSLTACISLTACTSKLVYIPISEEGKGCQIIYVQDANVTTETDQTADGNLEVPLDSL